MRIACIKPGTRLSTSKVSELIGGPLLLADHLQKAGHEVVIGSYLLPSDQPDPRFTWQDLAVNPHMEADVMLWFNGSVDFQGGVKKPWEIASWTAGCTFKGPIAYLMNDTNLPLLDLRVNLKRHGWADDYDLTQLDVTKQDVTLVCQGSNERAYLQHHNHSGRRADAVPLTKVKSFPMQLLGVRSADAQFNPSPEFDLGYGGGKRRGKRLKPIQEYFGSPADLKSYIFGNLDADDFVKPPRPTAYFGPKVPWARFISEMNRCATSVLIGDPIFNKLGHTTSRLFESILGGAVMLCAPGEDPDQLIFDHDDWLRVRSGVEAHAKIRQVVGTPGLREELLSKQLERATALIDVAPSFWVQCVEEVARGV